MRRGGSRGFPRFEKCNFRGEFPFAEVRFGDQAVPLDVSLIAWNPLIPLNKNSGIAAILEYTLHNTSSRAVDLRVFLPSFASHPGLRPDQTPAPATCAIEQGRVSFNREASNAEAYGSATLTMIGGNQSQGHVAAQPRMNRFAFRPLARSLLRNFTANEGSNSVDKAGRNGASILVEGQMRTR